MAAPLRLARRNDSGRQMQDLTMLFYTFIFFGVAFLYVRACQKLR